MGATQQFSLRWNNYVHHITNAFDSLRSCEDLVDVTLVCDRKKIYAHKMLLSACSEYFRDVFKENPCKHPVIIFRNVKYEDLLAIIDFMYHGEVNVEQEQLTSFLTTAEMLAVQGLSVGSTPAKDEGRKKQAILLDSKSINAAHDMAQNRSFTPKPTNRSVTSQNPVNSSNSRSPIPHSPTRKRRMSPPPKASIAEKNQPKRRPAEVHKEESNEPADAASFSEEDGMMDVSELELSREADETPIKEETEMEPEELGDKLALERTEQAGTSAGLEAASVEEEEEEGGEEEEEYLEEGDDKSGYETYVVVDDGDGQVEYEEMDKDSNSHSLVLEELEEGHEEGGVAVIVESDGEDDSNVEFIYAESVNENNEVIVGPAPRFQCTDCSRVFKRHDSLLKHAKMHAGMTQCPLCSSVFSRVSHLTRHVKIKHPGYPMVVRRGRPPRHSQ